MKKKLLKSLFIILFFINGSVLLAQGPPDPPDNPETGGGPVGGPAPVGSGIGILLSLGAAYGGRKVYKAFKNQELEE